MNILVTGGTVFASRFTAEYFIEKGHNVYVLNRGNDEQSVGALHIKADRHSLGDTLKKYRFDAVLDVTAYLSLIHISEPTRLLSISYAVFCLKKKNCATSYDTFMNIIS